MTHETNKGQSGIQDDQDPAHIPPFKYTYFRRSKQGTTKGQYHPRGGETIRGHI